MTNRKPVSIRLPEDLIEEIQREADLRGADWTAIVEERLRKKAPLHNKIDLIIRLLRERKSK